jgi:hypothetical protein
MNHLRVKQAAILDKIAAHNPRQRIPVTNHDRWLEEREIRNALLDKEAEGRYREFLARIS